MTPSDSRPRTSLVKAASRNLVISAAGSVLTYLSFMLVAYMFGATAQTDVFMFASAFVVLVSGLITTVLGAIFLPLYIKLLHGSDGVERASVFAGAFLVRLSLLAAAGGGLILAWPIPLFAAVSKFDPAVLADNQRLLAYFSVVFALSVLNEYLRVLLQAREAFVPASLSIVLQPAAHLACVWGLASVLGYESLAFGAAASRALQFAFLAWNIRVLGLRFRSGGSGIGDFIEFFRVARPYWMASIVTTGAAFFADYLASGLPAGTLTAVAFAQKIYLLPISLLAMPVIEVLNTRLSLLHARREVGALTELYATSVKIAVFAMFPVAALMAFDAREITGILLARGAYSEESLTVTAQSLAIYALAIPFIVLFSINGRISLVLQKTRIPSLFGSIGHLVMIGVLWGLVHSFEFIGLPMAKLVVEVAYFLPFGFLVVRCYLPSVDFSPILVEIAKIALAAGASLGLISGLIRYTQMVDLSSFPFLIVSSLGFAISYYVACRALRLDSLLVLKAALKPGVAR